MLQLTLLGGSQAASLNLTQQYPDFTVTGLSYSYDATTGILKIGRVENNAVLGGNDDWMCNPGETCTGTGAVGSYSAAAPPSPQLHVTTDPTNTSYVESFSLYADLNGSGSVQSGSSFRVDGLVRTYSVSGAPPPSCFPLSSYLCVLYDGQTVSGGLWSGSLNKFGWSGTGATGIIEFEFNAANGILGSQGLGYTGGGMIFAITNARQTIAGTPLLTDFNSQLLTVSWTATSGTGDVFVPIPAAVWLFGSGLLALLGAARRKALIIKI